MVEEIIIDGELEFADTDVGENEELD